MLILNWVNICISWYAKLQYWYCIRSEKPQSGILCFVWNIKRPLLLTEWRSAHVSTAHVSLRIMTLSHCATVASSLCSVIDLHILDQHAFNSGTQNPPPSWAVWRLDIPIISIEACNVFEQMNEATSSIWKLFPIRFLISWLISFGFPVTSN